MESATADYFPNSPQNQLDDSEGEPTPELAALRLLNFGRIFDKDSYEADTTQAGRVIYNDAQGAPVATVVVTTTPHGRYVATAVQVCTSALARDFSIYTHCGVESAKIDGQWWHVVEPLYGEGGPGTGPPAGWDDPFQRGRIAVAADRAVFSADGGLTVVLEPAEADAPVRLCR